MKPPAVDDELPSADPQWRLWHAFGALGCLSAIFALLVALDMTAAIGFVLAGLVFLAVQALLLAWVMQRLRQKAYREESGD